MHRHTRAAAARDRDHGLPPGARRGFPSAGAAGALGLVLASLVGCGGGGGDPPASPIDAGAAPAPDAATDDNPLGIALTEVTYELGDGFSGGRDGDELLGVGSGASAADIDGDGRLDLFLARCDIDAEGTGGPSLLLRQVGDGERFPRFSSDPDLASEFAGRCAHGASFGDYDRDGDPDLFVAMTGPDRLYRNDDGVLVDVSAAAGVAGAEAGAGAGDDINTNGYWADVNHDGLLDLLVTAHTAVFPPAPDPINANRMYIARGDGQFVSVAESAGVSGDGSSQAAAIGDLDGDGDLEIYIANDRFVSDGVDRDIALDRDRWLDLVSLDDQGLPRYEDKSGAYGVDGPRSSMGVAVSDVDGDGHEDIYVADLGANHLQIWDPEAGRYDDRASEWGLALRESLLLGLLVAWDVVFTDLDRDGGAELIVVHGSIEPPRSCNAYVQLDVVMRYQPELGRFVDITESVGLPYTPSCPPQDDRPLAGRGILLADLDGDHDDDLVITPHVERYRFYRNDTPLGDRHMLRVVPRGSVSAPLPYGAELVVTMADGQVRRQRLHAGGTHTQRLARFDLGLGADDQVESAILSWPSGYRQALTMSPGWTLDRTFAVTEPEWLTLTARAAGADDEAPVLTYRPASEAGDFLGAAAAGREVAFVRSDGVAVPVTDHGDGRYSAALPHPGEERITVLQVVDGGETLRPRLSVYYR
ncbi:MAG: hypothetical protein Tsb0020_37130 [Haliangiales bacterium]